ncbi:efflux RND transporter periplasmic adaptor subunit [bacterium]|nr:efflux RND transporter periplasmic adaptor subunit [bacterium]
MKKNIIIVLLLIFAAIMFRLGTSKYGQIMKSKAMMSKPAPDVVVEEIGTTDVIKEYEAPGRIASKYQVSVMARISGYLQKSYFKEGDYVKKGQALFLIEPGEYKNAADVVSADIKNIKAQLDYAEKQLARAKELVAKDYIAKARYDEILSSRDALRAQLASANARAADANRNLGYTTVKSPVDGRVGIITVTVGNYVTPSSGAITTINSDNPIYVTFPLEAGDFAEISNIDGATNANRKVELLLQNGAKYRYDGVQDFHDNKVDQTTGTVVMRATFKNPNSELIHGEFVTVKLYANNSTEVPVVPQIAVQENQEGKYVYKIDEKGLPQLTYIKTSGQKDDLWIVSSGIKSGDKIVTDGLQKVVPGKPIHAVSVEEMAKIRQNQQNNALEKSKNKFFRRTKK